MKNPIRFANTRSENYFGFDENGTQYRFDQWWRARDFVDEDPEHRSAMKQVITTNYETYQHVFCALCSKVGPMVESARRICLACAKKRGMDGLL